MTASRSSFTRRPGNSCNLNPVTVTRKHPLTEFTINATFSHPGVYISTSRLVYL